MVALLSSQALAWEKLLVNKTNSVAMVQLGYIPYSGDFTKIPPQSEAYVELAPKDWDNYLFTLTGHLKAYPPIKIHAKPISRLSCKCQRIARINGRWGFYPCYYFIPTTDSDEAEE